MKRVTKYCKKDKINPWYVGPYGVLQQVEKVANELRLPSELASVHPVFHVSCLRSALVTPYPFSLSKG